MVMRMMVRVAKRRGGDGEVGMRLLWVLWCNRSELVCLVMVMNILW